jgi:hypothetical protein
MKKYESSQNLMSLTLKTKKWCNYMPSRRFGKYKRKIFIIIQFVEYIDRSTAKKHKEEKSERWRSIISQVNLWERYSCIGP